jgi:hypothetical protein
MGLNKVETDSTILTSSVDASYEVLKGQQSISDQVTIRNAVSSVNLEAAGGKPIAWANAGTNSRGSISSLSESRRKGVLCRAFKTSRESFDGVSLYAGEACLGRDGNWYMRSFERS